MDKYFDKLTYLKAQKLHKLTGQEEYRQAMGETMTGLNPLGMNATSWVSMFRSLPHAEKRYFNAFLQTSDPDKREEITESVSPEVAELLKIKWAQQEGGEDKQALSDFRASQDVSQFIRDEGIPGADWMGWAPAVKIQDVKMISAKHEGWDAHDFGLGWRDQVRRMEQSPFNPGPIQMTQLSKYDLNDMSPSVAVDKNTLITAINKALSSEGIVGNVSIDQIPGGVGAATGTGDVPSHVEIRVKRKQLSGNTALYNLSTAQRASLNG